MPKKLPQRMCVGCRQMKEKAQLIRVVRSPEGEVSLDTRGKKPGRGAYLCPDPACFKRAVKSKALERAFSAPLPPEVLTQLEAQLAPSTPPWPTARPKRSTWRPTQRRTPPISSAAIWETPPAASFPPISPG